MTSQKIVGNKQLNYEVVGKDVIKRMQETSYSFHEQRLLLNDDSSSKQTLNFLNDIGQVLKID